MSDLDQCIHIGLSPIIIYISTPLNCLHRKSMNRDQIILDAWADSNSNRGQKIRSTPLGVNRIAFVTTFFVFSHTFLPSTWHREWKMARRSAVANRGVDVVNVLSTHVMLLNGFLIELHIPFSATKWFAPIHNSMLMLSVFLFLLDFIFGPR